MSSRGSERKKQAKVGSVVFLDVLPLSLGACLKKVKGYVLRFLFPLLTACRKFLTSTEDVT